MADISDYYLPQIKKNKHICLFFFSQNWGHLELVQNIDCQLCSSRRNKIFTLPTVWWVWWLEFFEYRSWLLTMEHLEPVLDYRQPSHRILKGQLSEKSQDVFLGSPRKNSKQNSEEISGIFFWKVFRDSLWRNLWRNHQKIF